jgi:hypothetical protein
MQSVPELRLMLLLLLLLLLTESWRQPVCPYQP